MTASQRREAVSAALLRGVVAVVLIGGAAIKILAFREASYESTLAWRWAEGSALLLATVVALEAGLGALIGFRAYARGAGIAILAMVTVFSVMLLMEWASAPGGGSSAIAACGCLGAPSPTGESFGPPVHLAFNAALATAVCLIIPKS
ncbi:MAG: MauE/DoxX family redox-associated membrane protein [Planctomycetota bacterium]|jgi:multisubunit Na+/H+ antiporter MnhB subunit